MKLLVLVVVLAAYGLAAAAVVLAGGGGRKLALRAGAVAVGLAAISLIVFSFAGSVTCFGDSGQSPGGLCRKAGFPTVLKGAYLLPLLPCALATSATLLQGRPRRTASWLMGVAIAIACVAPLVYLEVWPES